MAAPPRPAAWSAATTSTCPTAIPSTVEQPRLRGHPRRGRRRYEKAVALQQWFREDGGFTYDLDAAPGNGTDDLVSVPDHGRGGRTGYCEQFAVRDGGDGPDRWASRPGSPSASYQPRQIGSRDLGVQRRRPARLARALLPGIGLGAVRADPVRPGRRGAGLHHRAGQPARLRRRPGRTPAERGPAQPRGELQRPRATRPLAGRRATATPGQGSRGVRSSAPAAAVLVAARACCSCRPRSGARRTPTPDRRRPGGAPGRSSSTPRPTWGSPGPSTAHPARRGTRLVRQLRPAGAGRHPRAPGARSRTSRPIAVEALDRIVLARGTAPLRPGRAGGRPGSARQGPRDLRRGPARRRHPRGAPPGGLVAAVGAASAAADGARAARSSRSPCGTAASSTTSARRVPVGSPGLDTPVATSPSVARLARPPSERIRCRVSARTRRSPGACASAPPSAP